MTTEAWKASPRPGAGRSRDLIPGRRATPAQREQAVALAQQVGRVEAARSGKLKGVR